MEIDKRQVTTTVVIGVFAGAVVGAIASIVLYNRGRSRDLETPGKPPGIIDYVRLIFAAWALVQLASKLLMRQYEEKE